MILSDDEIKESHAPYAVFRVSHLLANARIRELENEVKRYKSHISRLNGGLRDMRAKLRELAAAAEWRDEVGKFYNEPKHIAGLTDSGWDDIFSEENCRISDAEATYRAALAAAKEG